MLLLRCLYGLKQAPRGWNQHIDDVRKEMGFHLLESDFGLYILGEGSEALYLALYVDNMFLLCIEIKKNYGVKTGLGETYNIKDLGEVKFLLGLEIRRQQNGDIFLCQEKYGKKLLDKFGMRECNSVSTPLKIGVKFSENMGEVAEGAAIEGVGYKSAMDSLLYLCSGTRPHLAPVVISLCRYSQNPGEHHWEGVKRVLIYLQGIVTLGLMYKGGADLPVAGYSDASHGDDFDTRRGRARYVFMSGGAAVS